MFDSAFDNGTLGHAYLLCGDAGCGKFAVAFDLAQALLCLSDTQKPCGECVSCKKVKKYSHSDFHVIMPVVLEKEHKSSDGKLSVPYGTFVRIVLTELKNLMRCFHSAQFHHSI